MICRILLDTLRHFSLVEEHDVRLPDLVWREPEHADAAVVGLVPLQLVVVPHQPQPHVGLHDLVFLILRERQTK